MLPLVANVVTLAGASKARVRFAAATRDPATAQRAILERLLRAGRDSAYGRAHDFASITSPAQFAARVPAVEFDVVRLWIERVEAGEHDVLTTEPTRFLEPTGGSSGYVKLVPYTGALLGEFSAATMPWLFDLLAHRPALLRGCAYWAITPPARLPARTPGGVAIGMQDDADYFPAPLRAMLRRTLAVPASVATAGDVAACRHLTLLALLGAPDLALVSVWSPSFLTTLATTLDESWLRLLGDLEHGVRSLALAREAHARIARELPARPDVARSLRARFGRRAPDDLDLVWRELALISCWTEGHAALALPALRARFPRVELQGKGLLATEGVVSIPLLDSEAPVAAVASHYLELLDADDRAIPIHEGEIGETYEVLLTTGGGLYRYRLRDLVRVEGRRHRTPLLSFRGRADRASDLAGEKLTPGLAERAIADGVRATGVGTPFAMLAPALEPMPHYRLYAETTAAEADLLASEVERRLLGAHHYALCRALGQLGPVQGVSVPDGHRAYERACVARGQRAGAIKPPALECALGWHHTFEDQPELVLR